MALSLTILTGMLAFMLHISGHISLTNYALEKSGTRHGMFIQPLKVSRLTAWLDIQADFWDGFEGGFLNHIEQVEQDLAAAGLPRLAKSSTDAQDTLSRPSVAPIPAEACAGVCEKTS